MMGVVLLAAGTSSRMGETNKLLLPYRGKPMVRHIAEQLLELSVGTLIVVTGYEDTAVRAALEGLDIDFRQNNRYQSGMSSSIKVGVRSLDEGVSGIMICLSDMPLLSTGDYQFLMEVYQRALGEKVAPIVQPWAAGRPGNPLIFHPSYREDILLMPDGPDGCRNLVLANIASVYRLAPPNAHFFKDIDCPSDYLQL